MLSGLKKGLTAALSSGKTKEAGQLSTSDLRANINTAAFPSYWSPAPEKQLGKQDPIDMAQSYTERLPRILVTVHNARGLGKGSQVYCKVQMGRLEAEAFKTKKGGDGQAAAEWNEEFLMRIENGPEPFLCQLFVLSPASIVGAVAVDLFHDLGMRFQGDTRRWSFKLHTQGEVTVSFNAQTDLNFPNMVMKNIDGMAATVSLPFKQVPDLEVTVYQAIRLSGEKKLQSYVEILQRSPHPEVNGARSLLRTQIFKGYSPFWEERVRVPLYTKADSLQISMFFQRGGKRALKEWQEERVCVLALSELVKVATATESCRWYAFVGKFKGGAIGLGFKACSNMKAIESLPDTTGAGGPQQRVVKVDTKAPTIEELKAMAAAMQRDKASNAEKAQQANTGGTLGAGSANPLAANPQRALSPAPTPTPATRPTPSPAPAPAPASPTPVRAAVQAAPSPSSAAVRPSPQSAAAPPPQQQVRAPATGTGTLQLRQPLGQQQHQQQPQQQRPVPAPTVSRAAQPQAEPTFDEFGSYDTDMGMGTSMGTSGGGGGGGFDDELSAILGVSVTATPGAGMSDWELEMEKQLNGADFANEAGTADAFTFYDPNAGSDAYYDPSADALGAPPSMDDLDLSAYDSAPPSMQDLEVPMPIVVPPVRSALIATASAHSYAPTASALPAFDFDDALTQETPAPKPAAMTRHVASLLDELGDMNTLSAYRPRQREAELVQRMTLALPKDDLLQRLAELDRLKSAEDALAAQLARLESAAADGLADMSQVARLQIEWRQLNERKTMLMTEGLPSMTGSATEISSSYALTDDELLGANSALNAFALPEPEPEPEPEPVAPPQWQSQSLPPRSLSNASLSAPSVRMSFDEDDVDAILSAATSSNGSPRKLPGAANRMAVTAPGRTASPSSAPASAPTTTSTPMANTAARGRPMPVPQGQPVRPMPTPTRALPRPLPGPSAPLAPAPAPVPAAAAPSSSYGVPSYACTLCKQSFPKAQLSLVRNKPFCASCKARLAAQAKQRGMNL